MRVRMSDAERRRRGQLIMDGLSPYATTLRGVTMRSKLEADFARHLDAIGVPWVYEPRVYGPAGAGYLPDFQIETAGGTGYVEVKPTLAEVPMARERMEVIWGAEPGVLLMVACAEHSEFWVAERPGGWDFFADRWKHR